MRQSVEHTGEAVVSEAFQEGLRQVMMDLRKLPGVAAVGVIRRDGILIDELLPRSVDAGIVAAMAAAIVGTAEMAIDELHQGTFRQSIVECQDGMIISMGAGEEALLVALLKPNVNLGLVLMTMEEQASRVGGILATR